MKSLLICIFFAFSFGQINWEIEIVDTVLNPPNEYEFQNALALDTNGIPHILYNKRGFSKLIYAQQSNNSVWIKELVDSGLFYACPSLVFDKNNIAHCSYYQVVGQTAYLCYAYRDSLGWVKFVVDSILGVITNWWFSSGNYFRTSIDIDTSDYSGIAYSSFNPADSVFFIKYAQFDGFNWNISVVEYDTGCGSINQPSDQFPSLKFNSQSIPHIAYHHIVDQTDTIKLAYWNDNLSRWIIEPVYEHSYGCAPVSLAIDAQNIPYVAHGVDVALYCSWRVNSIWYHEWAGEIEPGWVDVSLALDVGNSNNPGIVCAAPFLYPTYVYKDSVWHSSRIIDSLGFLLHVALDTNNEPHICFYRDTYNNQINIRNFVYAKGTFVGIDEDKGYGIRDAGYKMEVYPNISRGILNIEYTLTYKNWAELVIYDVGGVRIKTVKLENCLPGNYQETLNLGDLTSGVYFVVLKQNNEKVSKKFIFIK